MPSALTIRMTGDREKRHGTYLASLLQGVMMERIDTAYARKLHESTTHPYSQYVEEKGEEVLWHIHVLTQEAEEEILGPLQESDFGRFVLEHRDETFQITGRDLKRCSYEELIEGFYLGNCGKVLPLHLETPMAFKQAGRYCIFPTPRLIFQSLMMRFDACSPDSSIFAPEMLEDFESLTEISDYRLRSVRYSLQGVRIPSFSGDLKIRVNGPQQMANVAWMLAKFGEYSGIGIKTGMGMGAVLLEDRLRKGRRRIQDTETAQRTQPMKQE